MNRGTGRGIAAAWGVAMALVLAVALALLAVGERAELRRLTGVGTLMVGTSLVRYASPRPEGDVILATLGPPPFLRLAFRAGSEREILGAAEVAARAGVPTVFVEVNPIVSLFHVRGESCSPVGSLRYSIARIRNMAGDLVQGKDIYRSEMSVVRNFADRVVIDEKLSLLYPLTIHGSCYAQRWRRLVTGHPGTRLVFLAMPRAPMARELVGAADMARFNDAARAFAADLGAPIFVADPDGTWEARYFVDQAHLSAQGAARFREALVLWWQGRR